MTSPSAPLKSAMVYLVVNSPGAFTVRRRRASAFCANLVPFWKTFAMVATPSVEWITAATTWRVGGVDQRPRTALATSSGDSSSLVDTWVPVLPCPSAGGAMAA
jgi:hypothetical protein